MMLNYIWIALLFLGIGAAVTTDIINKNDNKYRNNIPLPVKLQADSVFFKNPSKNNLTKIIIAKESYNKFFNDKTDHDLSFVTEVIWSDKSNKYSAHFIVEKNDPQTLKDIASASGDKNDISGTIVLSKVLNDNTAEAVLVFEEVNFLKLKDITNAALDYAGIAVNIALGLIGVMALWLGIMKIAESAGLITKLASLLKPFTRRLFPDVPHDHPAMGSMIMNMSANFLGLGNAATPFGLKAMEELDTLNPEKGTATNAMCTFLAINTAGLTLIPASAIAVRAALGSANPAAIIGTSAFGATCATIVGVATAKICEKFPMSFSDFIAYLIKRWKLFAGIFFIGFVIVFASSTGFFTRIGPIIEF